MSFDVGDRVESMHNRIEPTGHFGVVVAVENKPGSGGIMITVRGDDMGDDQFPMWAHEDYFRLAPNDQAKGPGGFSPGPA